MPASEMNDNQCPRRLTYRKTVKQGTVSPQNQLNDLDSKAWVAFTKSWFVENPIPRQKDVRQHPAKYPESLVKKFLQYFTKNNDSMTLDPFAGTGSTLVAVDQLNAACNGTRQVIGWELNPHYAAMARQRTQQPVISADALTYAVTTLPALDFIMTSPPYWRVLHKTSGHINPQRKECGVDVVYSNSEHDLGNIDDYDAFIDTLSGCLATLSVKLKHKKFCVLVLSSTNRQGQFYPLPYDVARTLQKKSTLVLKGERIWCQDNKALMPYGYPYSFVPNFTHHTCLIFRQEKDGC